MLKTQVKLAFTFQGVSVVPDVESFPVDENASFLIVASDGLWDVCEDQQAVDLVKGMSSSK